MPSRSPAASNPEHKGLSAHVGLGVPPGQGEKLEGTFPLDSATFSHFPSWRSAPARLLVLLLSSSLAVQCFFCCYSLSPGNQWTVVCVPRLRFVSISLSPILFPFRCTCAAPKLLPARAQCLCWKRKSRIRSCLKPGVRGKRELPTAHLGICPGPAATLEPWELKRGLHKHATLVIFYRYIYFPVQICRADGGSGRVL